MSQLKKVFQALKAAREAARREEGFNLIELMVVITIMGILMGIVGVSLLGTLDSAKADTTRTQIANLKQALTYYKIDNGRYPTSSEGLEALIRPPASAKKKKKYIESSEVPKDGWDNDFQYFSPGTHGDNDFEIISLGADGQAGGEEENADINSWEK